MAWLGTITILAGMLTLNGCTVLPTEPSGNTYDSPIGTWFTKWQAMSGGSSTRTELNIVDQSTATYEWNDGKITFFEITGDNQWTGYWTEDWARKCEVKKNGLERWGIVNLSFNDDYNHFDGTWDSCGVGKKAEWSGFR